MEIMAFSKKDASAGVVSGDSQSCTVPAVSSTIMDPVSKADLLEPSVASPYQYVVTAQKPTAVHHAVTGNFVSQRELCLIVGKGTRIEIHTVGPEGLVALLEVNIYGRIGVMKLFRPEHEKKDLLLIVTESYQFCVLSYNEQTCEINTRAAGEAKDRVGRAAESGMIGMIDPLCQMIGLRIYNGVYKVIPVNKKGALSDAYNVRLDELSVLDMVFLHGYPRPTMLVLYEDHREARHVKTYEFSLQEKEISSGPWEQSNMEAGSCMLIPVRTPFGGAIIVGEQTITYHNGKTYRSIAMENTIMVTYTEIDTAGTRFLLGDMFGKLYVLLLILEGNEIVNIKLETLGLTSWPSCLTYLDNGIVYLGSSVGDSQLIRLSQSFIPETTSYLEFLENYPNLGPIVDCVVVDRDKQGQGQIVTCSGGGKDGSLRVIRNGIGIYEHAVVDLYGVKGVWAAHDGTSVEGTDNILCVSFVGETRFIRLVGDEMDVYQVDGLKADAQSLYCGCVGERYIVQVVSEGVRVVTAVEGKLTGEWIPPYTSSSDMSVGMSSDVVKDEKTRESISVADGNKTQLVVATGGSRLVYLRFDSEGGVHEVKSVVMDNEIACVSLSPVGELYPGEGDDMNVDSEECVPETDAHLVAVGLWTDISVHVLYLPSLTPAAKARLGGDVIPRSLLIVKLDDTFTRVICALGDGTLIYYTLEIKPSRVTEACEEDQYERKYRLLGRKHVTLATQPIELTVFKTNDRVCVFAASDRPSVIYSSHGKLIFSNVNVRGVSHMCPLNSEAFPDSLALFSDTQMTIGVIDEIEKLHIRTIPLGEMPRRISHMESTATLAVASILTTLDADFREVDNTKLRLHDEQTFELLDSYEFEPTEDVCSMCVITFSDEGTNAKSKSSLKTDTNMGTNEKDGSVSPNLKPIQTRTRAPTGGGTSKSASMDECEGVDGDTPMSTEYYAVGTAFVVPSEDEPRKGRVYLFEVVDGKLKKVLFKEFKSASYAMCVCSGRLLVSHGSKLGLYSLRKSESDGKECKELSLEYSYHGGIIYLYVKARGDFVLAGDLMKSVSLLANRSANGQIELIASDYDSKFMTAVELLDDDHFLGSESGYNIFTVKKNADAATDAERESLDMVGGFHTGEFINSFRHGSLVMRTGDEPPEIVRPNIVFCTVSGMIGVMGSLTEEMYVFLAELQSRLSTTIKGVGGFKHSEWREYKSYRRTKASWHYIDGDLIEQTLDLPPSKLAKVCKGLKWWDSKVKNPQDSKNEDVDVDDLIKFVEDMSRIH
eukprot:CFRG6011T1